MVKGLLNKIIRKNTGQFFIHAFFIHAFFKHAIFRKNRKSKNRKNSYQIKFSGPGTSKNGFLGPFSSYVAPGAPLGTSSRPRYGAQNFRISFGTFCGRPKKNQEVEKTHIKSSFPAPGPPGKDSSSNSGHTNIPLRPQGTSLFPSHEIFRFPFFIF